MPFIVMTIPRMDSVSVTVRQVVKINGSEEQTVTANRVWDLSDDVLAAPIAQPSGLKDWAPFQLLRVKRTRSAPAAFEAYERSNAFYVGNFRDVASSRANVSAAQLPEPV